MHIYIYIYTYICIYIHTYRYRQRRSQRRGESKSTDTRLETKRQRESHTHTHKRERHGHTKGRHISSDSRLSLCRRASSDPICMHAYHFIDTSLSSYACKRQAIICACLMSSDSRLLLELRLVSII